MYEFASLFFKVSYLALPIYCWSTVCYYLILQDTFSCTFWSDFDLCILGPYSQCFPQAEISFVFVWFCFSWGGERWASAKSFAVSQKASTGGGEKKTTVRAKLVQTFGFSCSAASFRMESQNFVERTEALVRSLVLWSGSAQQALRVKTIYTCSINPSPGV